MLKLGEEDFLIRANALYRELNEFAQELADANNETHLNILKITNELKTHILKFNLLPKVSSEIDYDDLAYRINNIRAEISDKLENEELVSIQEVDLRNISRKIGELLQLLNLLESES